jgi:hypothetical protein
VLTGPKLRSSASIRMMSRIASSRSTASARDQKMPDRFRESQPGLSSGGRTSFPVSKA